MGGVSRSCSLIELGRRQGIYTAEETLIRHFYAFLDSCITIPPQEYDYMQVWALSRGTYVSRSAKESALPSPIYRFLHRLVASTICHRKECDKVPSSNLFNMWCLTHTEVIPDPAFGRRQRPRHVDPDCPEPTLDDMMRGLVAVQEERYWMVPVLQAHVLEILTMKTPFQPCTTSHDGAGTSETHLGDTDDDDDEGT
ncbi:unnamed protein product [Lactuca saligna]|uniref:Uncharacterized protein n=1 Tax=Lactuca saligna TaxID=75948 RepID=A0AA36E7E0_LACSI|nr:unnamed protein product [Lactuca saligna]